MWIRNRIVGTQMGKCRIDRTWEMREGKSWNEVVGWILGGKSEGEEWIKEMERWREGGRERKRGKGKNCWSEHVRVERRNERKKRKSKDSKSARKRR